LDNSPLDGTLTVDKIQSRQKSSDVSILLSTKCIAATGLFEIHNCQERRVMLHEKVTPATSGAADAVEKRDTILTPTFDLEEESHAVPKYRLPEGSMSARNAYQIVHDECMLDGNARLNLATFVTTWMDPEAKQLMLETMDKNMIDKTEYPQTAEIEKRCVNIIANLWNATDKDSAIGCSTVGSSEACMLGGLAMKWLWRDRVRKRKGLDPDAPVTDTPNLVISSGYQVVWEKFESVRPVRSPQNGGMAGSGIRHAERRRESGRSTGRGQTGDVPRYGRPPAQ
jgi:hypothetical protein